MREFIVKKAPWDKRKIYSESKFKFIPGVTILIGCNGSGKTSLLRFIKDNIKEINEQQENMELKIPVFEYDNYKQGGHIALQNALDSENMELLANSVFASEGERIIFNFENAMRNLGAFVTRNINAKEMFILFDAVESGLSIDNVKEIKDFFKFLLKRNKDKELYILVSSNNYEFCINESCFDIQHAKYIDIKSYEDYSDFIMKSRKYKDNSYKI